MPGTTTDGRDGCAIRDGQAPALARRAAWRRLGGLAVALGAFAAVFAVGGALGPEAIRAAIQPAGAWAPVLFVPAAALLGTALVPGAALAAAAGLLFGPTVGLVCGLSAAVLGAVMSHAVSSRAGTAAFETVASERVRAVTDLAREQGLLAVIVARLLPALPDGPMNHAFGVVGLRAWQLALGTLIASGPRALSYALVGANVDDLTGDAALVGYGLNVGTGVLGLVLGAWLVRRARRSRRRARQAAEVRTTAEAGSTAGGG